MGCMGSKEEQQGAKGGGAAKGGSSKGQKYVKQPCREDLAKSQHKEIKQTFSQVYKVDRLLGSGKIDAACLLACLLEVQACPLFSLWKCLEVLPPHLGLSPAGAEGNAYLVRDINSNKNWALKLLKLPLPARFVTSVFRSVCALVLSPQIASTM